MEYEFVEAANDLFLITRNGEHIATIHKSNEITKFELGRMLDLLNRQPTLVIADDDATMTLFEKMAKKVIDEYWKAPVSQEGMFGIPYYPEGDEK